MERLVFGNVFVILLGTAAFGLAGCPAAACQHPSVAGPDTVRETGQARPSIEYWDRQRIGANWFNQVPTREWLEAAAKANIKLVRLAFGKWKGKRRDFLLGSADNYAGLVAEDFATLERCLDIAGSLGVRIVLTPLGLPGARNRQLNDGRPDPRLWTDPEYVPQAIEFWQDVARRLKGHPAIAAYDLINEPHPEKYHGKPTFWRQGFTEWYRKVQGTPGDLNRFNRELVAGIRRIDPDVPIVVESGLHATPWAFEYLEPLADAGIIYSFHMYEPYEYTTRRINRGRFSYPGETWIEDLGVRRHFDSRALAEFLDPVRSWARRYRIPPGRIFAGEFGCDRRAKGAALYLADLVAVFNREGWHWAFYAFREDGWDAMDYELGTVRPGDRYWAAAEQRALHQHYPEIYDPLTDNTVWSVFKRELERRR